jgi:Permuted papain-like amidase enzyme, YaeF/YiiX, C92 family
LSFSTGRTVARRVIKRRLPIAAVVCLTFCAASCQIHNFPLREGDLVFQSFASSQTRAIQLATRSRFSHMGIILRHEDTLMVYEAVGPVKFTSISDWIDRDPGEHFVVKRLKNAENVLTKANLEKLERVAASFKGKPYDFAFNWSDEKIHCSELAWPPKARVRPPLAARRRWRNPEAQGKTPCAFLLCVSGDDCSISHSEKGGEPRSPPAER